MQNITQELSDRPLIADRFLFDNTFAELTMGLTLSQTSLPNVLPTADGRRARSSHGHLSTLYTISSYDRSFFVKFSVDHRHRQTKPINCLTKTALEIRFRRPTYRPECFKYNNMKLVNSTRF